MLKVVFLELEKNYIYDRKLYNIVNGILLGTYYIGNIMSVEENYKKNVMRELETYCQFSSGKRIHFGQDFKLQEREINIIKNYLRNPTENGIWRLSAKWNGEDSITKAIKQSFVSFKASHSEISIPFGKENLKFNLDDIKIDSISNKFTFVIILFNYMYYLENKDDKSLDLLMREIYTHDQQYMVLFEILNIEELRKKYADAYDFFVENLYFENMSISVNTKEILRFNKASILLEQPIGESIYISSLDNDSINIIKDFFDRTKLIYEVKIERYFSPEEIVFSSYVIYLQAMYEKIIEYKALQELMAKAISDYNSKHYSISIGTVGILVEDIFIQIFETLFRREANKSYTLGQRYDEISKNVSDLFPSQSRDPKTNIEDLFVEIDSILTKDMSTYNPKIQSEELEIIRKILHSMKEQNRHTEDLIKKAFHPDNKVSIFSKGIQANFNELLRYRNATSHKSRIPIGPYEATRTIYCAVNLIIWWKEERSKIDWSKSKEDIIKEFVKNNGVIK